MFPIVCSRERARERRQLTTSRLVVVTSVMTHLQLPCLLIATGLVMTVAKPPDCGTDYYVGQQTSVIINTVSEGLLPDQH